MLHPYCVLFFLYLFISVYLVMWCQACVELAKSVGEMRTETELLPQCWEQVLSFCDISSGLPGHNLTSTVSVGVR